MFVNVRHNPGGFLRYTGFASNHVGIIGWILGVVVALAFVALASRFPSVSSNLLRPSILKILALAVAIAAALCEECIFRKLLIDSLQNAGSGVVIQVLASGLLFGLAHGVWGFFRGSLAAAIGSIVFHLILSSCPGSDSLIPLETALIRAASDVPIKNDGANDQPRLERGVFAAAITLPAEDQECKRIGNRRRTRPRIVWCCRGCRPEFRSNKV